MRGWQRRFSGTKVRKVTKYLCTEVDKTVSTFGSIRRYYWKSSRKVCFKYAGYDVLFVPEYKSDERIAGSGCSPALPAENIKYEFFKEQNVPEGRKYDIVTQL